MLANIFKKTWFTADRYTTLATILLAVLGTITAVVGYISGRAGDISGTLYTQVTQQTMAATSTLALGQFTADYGWSQAYRLWLEFDTMGYLTYETDEQLTSYYDAVRNQLTELSPLLQEPYFNPEVDSEPDIRRFESDSYLVRLTRQQQELNLLTQLADFWGAKADEYGMIDRIIATCLLLVALVTSVIDNTRVKYASLIFVFSLAVYCAVQTVEIESRIPPSRPAAAMDKLADGVGLYHQYLYEDAITAFSEAIELDPEYVEAYVRRGFAYRDLFDEGGDSEILPLATADFEVAVEGGRSEIDVIGQLAELYYLQGKFEDAIRVSQIGVDETSEFIHMFDLARSTLASADIDTAKSLYADGIEQARNTYDEAEGHSPSVSFWRYLDIAMLELDDLAQCATEEICDGAPPYESLDNKEEIAQVAEDIASQLKNLSVQLEFPDVSIDGSDTVEVKSLTFTGDADFTNDTLVFEYGIREIEVSFNYANVPPDATMLMKVFIDNWEYPPLRYITSLSDTPDGNITFPLNPGIELGEYTVQLFVNGTLQSQTQFQIVYTEGE